MTVIEGYAVVWDSPSEIIGSDATGFVEVVKRGAFARSLRERDALALHSHNPDLVVGRVSSRTLTLTEDERGLRFRVELPDSQLVNDLVVEPVRRRDIQGMSFGFTVKPGGESWSLRGDGRDVRTLSQLTLYEVSTTGMPAYPSTTVFIAGTEPRSVSRARTAAAPRRERITTGAQLAQFILQRNRKFFASIGG